MKFPIVEAYGTKGAAVNEFRGLSRLPVTDAGEAAVFKNLTAEPYPAARTDFFAESGSIKIYGADGAAAVCAGGSIQYVFELVGEDNLLTGVYGGDFYHEGRKIAYYGPLEKDFKIKAGERIEMLKLGKRYVILAVGENKSSIWTYTPDGTSFGDAEQRAGDGYLKTDIIENLAEGFILFKLTGCPGMGGERVAKCEAASGKSYYCLLPTSTGLTGKKYPKQVKKLKRVDNYTGHYGTVIYLSCSEENLNPERYCFNDFQSEHPVRFVCDAAGTKGSGGTVSPLDALCAAEEAEYSADTDTTAYTVKNNCAVPFWADSDTEVKLCAYDYDTGVCNQGQAGGGYSDSRVSFAEYDSLTEQSCGIIGHFEKWNGEKRRYEFYGGEGCIYGVQDESGAELTGFYNKTGSTKKHASRTAISVNAVGIMTEAVTASHICAHGGRVCATSKDGSQVMLSAQGEYSRFADYASGASSSGFVESLTEGEFTAVCEYAGYLMLFKRGEVSIYYGSGAQDIAFARRIKVGCIDSRSIAEVGGVLYWLAPDGFYAFSGAAAEKISRKLERVYTEAVSFADYERYTVAAKSPEGLETLEYDPRLGVWAEKSAPSAGAVCRCAGAVVTGAGTLFKRTADAGAWQYESGDIFDGAIDDKGVYEIYIRARISGEAKVYTMSDGVRYEHKKITSDGAKIGVWRVPVRLIHKNYYRIGIEGAGAAVLYAIERITYEGGRTR